MGANFSAETNTSIQDTITKTMNEFISENSQDCEASTGASASVVIDNIKCGGDYITGDITTDASSNLKLQCLQANKAEANFETFVEGKLKNELKKETKDLIGLKVSLDTNTTLTKSVQEVVNKVKANNIMNCLTKNLSEASVIQKNVEASDNCKTGNINAIARSDTQASCIQKNESVMDAVSELNTNIETYLSNKTSSTGIVVMIIVGSIVALIIFIMIKKMKSKPSSGMALPMQMPMPSRLPVAYPYR